ncbi:MAG: DUF998 domain-containing protein [Cyclobacteriaceae bacterium]
MNLFLRLSGVLALCFCLIAYAYYSSSNPAYRHLTKAYSELASVGTPDNLTAALWAFFLPGLLVTVFFIKLPSYIASDNLNRYPFILLIISGILTTLGTSPMNYDNFSALSSQLHIVGVMGGGLVFLIGAFTVSKQLKKDPKWASLTKPLLILAWTLIISGFFRDSSFPGLAQKVGILAFYLYTSLLSWNAFRLTQLTKTSRRISDFATL